MESREILFKKIEAQEKEWDAQIKNLQSRVADFDPRTRVEFEIQINQLNTKLKELGNHTSKIKNTSEEIWCNFGDSIIDCWTELVHNIDYVISKLKNNLREN